MPLAKSPAIQGLRAIAVLAVVAYHLDWSWIQGGFLGVDLFFVLSGYLITSLALHEIQTSGRFSPGAFVGRRARRILPASVTVLLAILVFGWLGGWDSPPGGDVRWAALYVANWKFIFADVAYGASALTPSPILHFWSLAIEEQWYVVFPILMLVVGAIGLTRRRVLTTIFLGLALASSVTMIILTFSTNADVSRLYFGTDTRLFAILLGAAGAVVSGLHRPQQRHRSSLWRVTLAAGLIIIGVLFVIAREDAQWMYRGGFQLVALVALATICAAVASEPKFLAIRPLQKIGDFSYSIYLWHWPVIVATRSDRLGFSGTWQLVIRLALIIVLSVTSFRLIEQPFLNLRTFPRFRASRRASIAAAATVLLALAAIAFPGSYRSGSVNQQISQLNTAAETDILDEITAGKFVTNDPSVRRVMFVGDSVPFGLAWKFRRLKLDKYVTEKWGLRLQVINFSRPGCGIAPNNHGNSKYDCEGIPTLQRKALEQVDPDFVVLFAGTQDQLDLVVDGQRKRFGSDAWRMQFDVEVRRRIAELASRGAKLVVVLSPCVIDDPNAVDFDPNNNKTDDNRRRALNDYFREMSKDSSLPITVLDPDEFLCPGGAPIEAIDGNVVRFDGIHYSDEGQKVFWNWFAPQLLLAAND